MANPSPTTPVYDPDVPVYAQPDDIQDYQNVSLGEQKNDSSYINPSTATVEGRVQGILDNNSMLRRSTEADAAAASNSRGILNTTMGTQAGTAALLDKAVDIATPDAALYGDMAKMSKEADSQGLLANQEAEIAHNTSLNNAQISGALTTQEIAGQQELQKLSDNAQMQRVEVDNMWKQQIQFDQMDAADAQKLVDSTTSLGSALTGSVERILRDTNVENKTDAIEALMTQYQSQLTTAAAVVNIDLDWS